jgi:threonine aldolase
MGNVSRLAHAVPRPLPSNRGKIPVDVIEKNIHAALREHMTQTKAITLENTHNIWGGALLGLDYIKEVAALAKKYHLYLHLDGARVFNASTALNINVREITGYFDSVMFCLSKGLSAPVGSISAPVGSILAGTKEFIQEARYTRKFLGGGMRQAGILAAAGIVAIEKMIGRLADDHRRARQLAEQIADLPGIEVNFNEVETNMMMVKLTTMNSETFLKKLAERNVWALPFDDETVRIVTHKDIDDNDVQQAINAIRKIV